MIRSVFSILAVAAVGGLALAPGVASAATAGPAVLAYSSSPTAGDPDTTVTFTVTGGALTLTAPTAVNLGNGAPGGTISGKLSGSGGTGGPVTVTDNRALLAAAWTATAASTDWTTGGSTTPETIPAGDVAYAPGDITTTGTITATGTNITLANAPTLPTLPPAVVTGTAGVGDNTATWDPTLTVTVPKFAVGGTYSGTLTQSVA